jgi:putative ABC transport system permease protein
MMGNVKMLVGSVSAVVLFTILLVTAATMGMTIRERTREFGILKSLGFTRGRLVALMVGESLIVALGGWVIGCLGAKALFSNLDTGKMTGGFYPVFRVPADALLLGLALSLAVALLTAGIPAWRASRVNIAQALRFVG